MNSRTERLRDAVIRTGIKKSNVKIKDMYKDPLKDRSIKNTKRFFRKVVG